MSIPTHSGEAQATPSARRTLTSTKIIVLIVAALTPLSVVVGTLPLGLAFGGPSTALLYVVAGLIIGLFCVGYVQMVRRITRPGAFYNYIARGLGRPTGVGSAMIAVVTYSTLLIGIYAVTSVVNQEILAGFGINAPWQVWFVVQLLVVTVLAYRKIDLSARVTFVIVGLELLILLALVVGIVAKEGLPGAFPAEAFSPNILSVGQWTIAFVFAMLCFQAFEAGALYAPEAKNPERTVPRALYGALIILVVSFALVAWALTGVTGVDGLQEAVGADLAGFVFATTAAYLGDGGVWALSLLALLAQLACALATTNFVARYLNSLAREELLPAVLGRKNRHNSPGAAILILAALAVVIILGFAAVGIDPYTEIAPIGFGLGAVGATTLQALASGSAVGFFLRQPASERHWWKTTVAPILATVLLVAALCIELSAFSYITGKDSPEMLAVPWIIPLAGVGGLAFGFWLRKNRSLMYRSLAAGDTAEEAEELQKLRDQERSLSPDSAAMEIAGEK